MASKNEERSRCKLERKRIIRPFLTTIGVLFFTQPSFGQDVPLDLLEKFVESRCVVISPIFNPVIDSHFFSIPSGPPYNATATFVAHYRRHAEDVYHEMTRIAGTFDFDTLEQWAIVSDRASIVLLSLTAGPGMYNPIPADHVVVLPESQRAAGEVYLRITELVQTVSVEEKQLIGPHVDALQVSCIEFRR